MNGLYQFLWSASFYIAFVGLFFISMRWLMNKLNCQQTLIYQLWFIFPLGLLLLPVFQLTNIQMTDVSQFDFLVMPTIQVSAQNVSNIVSLSELTIMSWIIIASLMIIRLVYQYLKFKQALKLDIDIISKNVHESNFVTSPMAFGMIKPCVYLPKKYTYEIDKQQQLLLIEHELIHCKRYDPMLRMLYKILTITFWFHPVIYIINRMLKHDQETSVDQLVLMNPKNKSQKLKYSKLLFQVSQNLKSQVPGKVPEIYCSSNSMLKERIMLIKNNKPSNNSLKNKLISFVIITSAITATVVTTTSLANTSESSSVERLVIPQPPKVSHDHIKPPTPPKPVKAPMVRKSIETGVKIVPIVRVAPNYPRNAADNHITGYVTMDIDIALDGLVEEVRVVESVPTGVFDIEAVRSVQKYKFAPISQPVTIQQKVQFELD